MKKLKYFLLTAFAAGTVQIASAVNYSPTDLLLVFREPPSFPNDVVFDLGPVGNFLGHAAGTVIPVSYNASVVSNNFNNTLSGVTFILAAAVSNQSPVGLVWLTDENLASAPPDVPLSSFGTLRSKIESVGTLATVITSSNATPYFVDPITDRDSYDFIVSGGQIVSPAGQSPPVYLSVGTMGGTAPCTVEAVNPTTLAFYQVQVNNSTPQPPATLIGAFTLDALGNLSFTAGQLPPLPPAQISGISADSVGQTTTISFTTTNGVNYQLQYTTDLSGGWTPVPGVPVINGDGTVQSFTDPNAIDPARFYRIQSTY